MRIFHAADIHLGRRRLDGRLPDDDFKRAFDHIADQAIQKGADVFLIAGDLFDRPAVEPPHLRQAQQVLAKLKEAGIPVVATVGNHDKAFISSDDPTWLDYLADDELLILLQTRFGPDGPHLEPWTRETRRGSWIDLQGVRFTGAGYLGAATPLKFRQIVDHLDPDRVHGVLLHAGPDYFVGEGGGFSSDDLKAVKGRIAYLALGHIHKPMLHGGWACNPGSPENCELSESHYSFNKAGAPCPRGYAVVELDPTVTPPLRGVEIRSNPRRPVAHLALDCGPFGNKLKDGAAALESAACEWIATNKLSPETAVVLRLSGKLHLGRIALDLQVAATNIQQAAGVAAVALDATAINLDDVAGGASSADEGQTREQIERSAIRQLVDEENLWGLDGAQEQIAALFYGLKEGVRLGRSPDELGEMIQTSAVVDGVAAAIQGASDSSRGDGPAGSGPVPEGGTP